MQNHVRLSQWDSSSSAPTCRSSSSFNKWTNLGDSSRTHVLQQKLKLQTLWQLLVIKRVSLLVSKEITRDFIFIWVCDYSFINTIMMDCYDSNNNLLMGCGSNSVSSTIDIGTYYFIITFTFIIRLFLWTIDLAEVIRSCSEICVTHSDSPTITIDVELIHKSVVGTWIYILMFRMCFLWFRIRWDHRLMSCLWRQSVGIPLWSSFLRRMQGKSYQDLIF